MSGPQTASALKLFFVSVFSLRDVASFAGRSFQQSLFVEGLGVEGGRQVLLISFLRVALFVVVLVALVSRFAVLCGGLGGGSSVLRTLSGLGRLYFYKWVGG